MQKILILGSTGKLGKVLTNTLLKEDYEITVLVRNKEKLAIHNKNLNIIEGNPTDENDLINAIKGSDVVISTLGHGFRTSFPIQENTLKLLIPIMNKENIKRFITITGAGLITNEDPKSLILNLSNFIFKLIDPYRVTDAENQQKLLEKSNLDWTVVRTPIHNNSSKIKISYIGYKQPKPWIRISRLAISNFMIEIIQKENWIKKSPIIY